jgi:hypothetical protein
MNMFGELIRSDESRSTQPTRSGGAPVAVLAHSAMNATVLVAITEGPPEAWNEAEALPREGGVIKLPDGYVIDVAWCSWQRIAQLTGYENRLRSARGPRRRGVQQDILDACNVGAP